VAWQLQVGGVGTTYSYAFATMLELSSKLPFIMRLMMRSNGLDHVQSFSRSSTFDIRSALYSTFNHLY
jgi:hypothetical protein